MKNVILILAVLIGCGGEGYTGSEGSPCVDGNPIIVTATQEDALKLCVGWSAVKEYASEAACVSGLVAGGMARAMAEIECTTSMTEEQCSDYENQFVGASGAKHGFWIKSVGSEEKLVHFSLWSDAEFCPDPSRSRPYCNGTSEFSACFFKGC